MKPLLIIYFSLLVSNNKSLAQTFSCTDFSIIEFSQDSLNSNEYQLSIYFNAPINDFVGYPYISSIVDCNGDTVATGNMYYFAQLGETTQAYPVTTNNPSPWCEPLTAMFIFGNGPLNEADTCYFSFETAGLHAQTEKPYFSVFPNPCTSDLLVSCPLKAIGKPFRLLDPQGKVVLEGKIVKNQFELDIRKLNHGLYYFYIENEQFIRVAVE